MHRPGRGWGFFSGCPRDGVRRHTISTHRRCVLPRLLTCIGIFQSTTPASWCVAPRISCTAIVEIRTCILGTCVSLAGMRGQKCRRANAGNEACTGIPGMHRHTFYSTATASWCAGHYGSRRLIYVSLVRDMAKGRRVGADHRACNRHTVHHHRPPSCAPARRCSYVGTYTVHDVSRHV